MSEQEFVNKYELTATSRVFKGVKVYRIRALRTFSDIYEGALGGWVEQEANLSQYGDCWVDYEAVAMGDARVRSNARMLDYAVARENAILEGNCTVADRVVIHTNAVVSGETVVSGVVIVGGSVKLRDAGHIQTQDDLTAFIQKRKLLKEKSNVKIFEKPHGTRTTERDTRGRKRFKTGRM